LIFARNLRFFAGSLKIVAGSLRILEVPCLVLKDYRWGSLRFSLKILMQIFKDL